MAAWPILDLGIIVNSKLYIFLYCLREKVHPDETEVELVKEEVSSVEIDGGPSFGTFR